jgi:phage gp29-like protein
MPNRDILRFAVTQWTPGIKPTWRISEVRQALRLHAEGDFSLSAQLVDTMGEDDELPGALEKRVDAVLGSDFRLEPVDAPNPGLSERLAEQFGPLWWEMFPESELAELLRWKRMLGVGLAVLDWERGGSRWAARLRVLHPQFLRRDEFNGRWLYSAREGVLEVTPGDGKWILLVDGQRGWMHGAIRALAITWISKQLTIRDWNRYNERHGLPIIKGYAPAIADEADKDLFWEDLKQLAAETVVQLPTHLDDDGAKFDLDLLEAKDQSWQAFEKHLERCDRKFQVYLLGGNLASEVVDQGARATAETHRGVERSKAKADAEKLSTDLRRQGLFPIVGYNVAAVAVDVIPWPKWDTEPVQDDKAEAESKEAFGKALKAIGDAGYDVENVDDLAKRYGLELKKREVAPPVETGFPDGNPRPEQGAPRAPGTPNAATKLRAFAEAARTGLDDGQAYVERLVESAIEAAGPAGLDRVIAAVLEELEAAGDYEDLRQRLRTRYESLDTQELTDLLESVMVLAELAGRASVNQDG